jgi:uncharacterized protein (TIGR02118 family)
MPASLVILASRPPKWTQEQFTTWWRGEHAAYARKLPCLQAYRHGVVVFDYDRPEQPAWDGHAVLTFPTREALDAALRSPEWDAAVSHVGKMKGRRIAMITDEADLLSGAPANAAIGEKG